VWDKYFVNIGSSRGVKKMWCVPRLDREFRERMEDVLDCYQRPYNPREPVIGVDEFSKQLLADKRPG
jgi:hypothetical protein